MSKIGNTKLMLDLCAGTGAWSEPYNNDSEYTVIRVEINEQLSHSPLDVLEWDTWLPQVFKDNDHQPIYGILAAPPCTDFSISGAWMWKDKDADGRTQHSLDIVDACLDIIDYVQPLFWALENPIGRLRKLRASRLGEPTLMFDPCEYGDYYTKRTLLWGQFNKPLTTQQRIQAMPMDTPQQLLERVSALEAHTTGLRAAYSKHHIRDMEQSTRQIERSITPPGFARAFYEANK